jgi:hypothetical protein
MMKRVFTGFIVGGLTAVVYWLVTNKDIDWSSPLTVD